MKLDWAMLANHAEIQNGIAFVSGGGIDTVHADQAPAPFNGAVALRLLVHPSETDRPHVITIRFVTEDGHQLAQLEGNVQVALSPDMPPGWLYPVMTAFNINGLPLPKAGFYSVDILADGAHLTSLPFRLKVAQQ